MPFDPIDSLNTQILNAIGATVIDATEKQNAADVIETFINSNSFIKEVLNDTLRDDIVNNHSGFAIVEVDSLNVVTVSQVTVAKAVESKNAITAAERRESLNVAYIAAIDTDNMTQAEIDSQVDALNNI